MAAKKKTTKKAPARRRGPVARKTMRRRSVQQAGFGVNPMSLGLAIAGAFVADQYAEKIPIKDEKARNGVLCIGAALLALKGPAQLRPFFVGAAVVGGVKTVAVMFPKLIAPATTTNANTVKRIGITNRTIGRLTAGEEMAVRDAVAYRMETNDQRMNGRYTPVTGPYTPVTGERYSPVTGMPTRRRFMSR